MSNSRTGSNVSHRPGGNDTRRLTPRMCAFKVRTRIADIHSVPVDHVMVVTNSERLDELGSDALALVIFEGGEFEWALDYAGGDGIFRWVHDTRTTWVEAVNAYTLAFYSAEWGL